MEKHDPILAALKQRSDRAAEASRCSDEVSRATALRDGEAADAALVNYIEKKRQYQRPENPTLDEIASLKSEGFFVHALADIDVPAYAWAHRSGASQADVKDRQPYRRSELQAWNDCAAYSGLNVPAVPDPDWTSL